MISFMQDALVGLMVAAAAAHLSWRVICACWAARTPRQGCSGCPAGCAGGNRARVQPPAPAAVRLVQIENPASRGRIQ